MPKKVYVFDPTVADQQSRVRGIGRYLQIMKENFENEFIFTSEKNIPYDSILINPFFNFFQPRFALKKIAKKQVTIIHDLIPLKFPRQFPVGIRGNINIFLNKLNLRHYDLIITESQAGKNDIVKFLNIAPEKIKIITPTLPEIFWRNQPTLLRPAERDFAGQANHYCLYVGDATWNKNLINLARAVKLANINCVFVGKVFENAKGLDHPWQQELKSFYQEIQNDHRFILKGFVSDEELVQLYRQAACNILISHDEGFGFSYTEALSQGCPSILADIPVFRETAQNNAIYVNQNNPEEIALAFKKITSQPNQVKSQPDLSRFSRQQFREQWLNCINSL